MNTALEKRNQSVPVSSLREIFANADEVISRQYLTEVSSKDIVPCENTCRNIRLYRINLLVYNPEENVNDKLVTVFSALLEAVSQVDLALIIHSRGNEDVEYYLGVSAGEETGTAAKLLQSGFLGNFPGSALSNIGKTNIVDCLEAIRADGNKDIACLTLLPTPRDKDKDRFIQGIEKFVETMRGKPYTAIILASSVKKQLADYRKSGLEMMYSALSPYSEVSLAFGENESNTVGESVSRASSESLSKGTSRSVSDSISSSDTVSESSSTSYRTDGFGDGWTFGRTSGTSHTDGKSHSVSNSLSQTQTNGYTITNGTTTSRTTGSSLTRTISLKNKTVQDMLAQLDRSIKRIDAAKSYGLWNCAAYFIANDLQTAALAANTYKGLLSGGETGDEDAHINYWSTLFDCEGSKRHPKYILDYLLSLKHPRFSFSKKRQDFKDAAVLVNGNDLPLLMGVPRKTIPGVVVFSIAEFGRKVYENQSIVPQSNQKEKRKIPIGKVFHMGQVEENNVYLDLDAFSSHCFVAGSTGSGKSNTTYGLLHQFIKNNIPFLVIEPAKGEYRQAFGKLSGINIFTTNPHYNQLLRINPFRFHPNIHILEHLDRLIEIFNCCWDMTAAMPAILKRAIEQSYIDCGWDLANSISLNDPPVFPTFRDLLKSLPEVISNSGYSATAQSDYRGALVSRVSSLSNGIFGQVLCDDPDLEDSVLFDNNTIIDLSRVGSMESKALLMGLLVIRLTEYRFATAGEANKKLSHVTVIEEAHNLLKRTGPTSSKLEKKAVEMICSSIAEMRTFGEGFIIVDQSPGAVDIAAIKNTNTKIIMKLPDKEDGESIGAAFSLNEFQMAEIPRLTTGTAIVMQSSWLNPVLTRISQYTGDYELPSVPVSDEDIRKIRTVFVTNLLPKGEHNPSCKESATAIDKELEHLDVNPDKINEYRERFLLPLYKQNNTWTVATRGEYLLNILKCHDAMTLRAQRFLDRVHRSKETKTVDLDKFMSGMYSVLENYCSLPKVQMHLLVLHLIKGLSLQENHSGTLYQEIIRLSQNLKNIN